MTIATVNNLIIRHSIYHKNIRNLGSMSRAEFRNEFWSRSDVCNHTTGSAKTWSPDSLTPFKPDEIRGVILMNLHSSFEVIGTLLASQDKNGSDEWTIDLTKSGLKVLAIGFTTKKGNL